MKYWQNFGIFLHALFHSFFFFFSPPESRVVHCGISWVAFSTWRTISHEKWRNGKELRRRQRRRCLIHPPVCNFLETAFILLSSCLSLHLLYALKWSDQPLDLFLSLSPSLGLWYPFLFPPLPFPCETRCLSHQKRLKSTPSPFQDVRFRTLRWTFHGPKILLFRTITAMVPCLHSHSSLPGRSIITHPRPLLCT